MLNKSQLCIDFLSASLKIKTYKVELLKVKISRSTFELPSKIILSIATQS